MQTTSAAARPECVSAVAHFVDAKGGLHSACRSSARAEGFRMTRVRWMVSMTLCACIAGAAVAAGTALAEDRARKQKTVEDKIEKQVPKKKKARKKKEEQAETIAVTVCNKSMHSAAFVAV